STTPLLATRDLDIEAAFDPVPSLTVSPSRVQVAGAALRIAGVQWHGGTPGAIDVQADIEPINVAPLLARLQPDFGWRGDLTIAGHAQLHSAPTFSAEVV